MTKFGIQMEINKTNERTNELIKVSVWSLHFEIRINSSSTPEICRPRMPPAKEHERSIARNNKHLLQTTIPKRRDKRSTDSPVSGMSPRSHHPLRTISLTQRPIECTQYVRTESR